MNVEMSARSLQNTELASPREEEEWGDEGKKKRGQAKRGKGKPGTGKRPQDSQNWKLECRVICWKYTWGVNSMPRDQWIVLPMDMEFLIIVELYRARSKMRQHPDIMPILQHRSCIRRLLANPQRHKDQKPFSPAFDPQRKIWGACFRFPIHADRRI